MKRLLVTGCGRSGTAFASTVLSAAGLKCGHEAVFQLRHAQTRINWRTYNADSSWTAVPWLRNRRLYSRAVLLVRDPLAVIQSWLELNLLSDPPTTPGRRSVHEIVYRFRPEVRAEPTQYDRCAATWLHWNTAALPYAHAVVRFEDVLKDARTLLEPFGIDARVDASRLDRVNQKVNKKRQTAPVNWGDFRPELSREVKRLAVALGYRYELRD